MVNLLLEKLFCHIFNIYCDIKNIELPKKCFGVFVTMRRSQILSDYPIDIHGCIGNWIREEMSKDQLLATLLKVGKDATFKDSRKNYFKRDILEDAMTKIDVSFMKLPLYAVDKDGFIKEKDKKFYNNEFGLIVENNETGLRATFLPGVFDNPDWNFIKKELEEKAGTTGSFYAYETLLYEKSFMDILPEIFNYRIRLFGTFLKGVSGIPYEIIGTDIVKNDDEYIRNISTILTMLELKINVPEETIINFYKKFIENKRDMRQASAFLLQCLQRIGKLHETKIIADYLYNNLETMEKEFELGEVITALGTLFPENQQKELLQKELIKMKDRISNASVFELNWQAKAVLNTSRSKEHAKLIFDGLLKHNITNENETNYQAVYFECLCSLYEIIKDVEIENKILSVFMMLEKRYNSRFGTYEFKDKRSRIDITGHVISGMLSIIFPDMFSSIV